MNSTEDRARGAMRAIADTVDGAPPLRLAPARQDTPATDEVRFGRQDTWPPSAREHRLGRRRPGGAPRPANLSGGRRRNWLAPVTVAAVITAIAVALVLIRDFPNGAGVTSRPSTTKSTTPPATSSGLPRYYVSLVTEAWSPDAASALQVGDTLTGKPIATLAAPAGTSFVSVSGAADDRTFVVLTVARSAKTSSGRADTWYEVKLAPGSAHPATLTRLPIESTYAQVVATALSGSGRELAVGGIPAGWGRRGVEVFSVATGQLLNEWSTSDDAALVSGNFNQGWVQLSVLTWIDGDQAIAFTYDEGQAHLGADITMGLRRLDVAGPSTGDLIADSRALWSEETAPRYALTPPCTELAPLVSADGTSVSCAALTSPDVTKSLNWDMTFTTYHLTGGSPSTGQGAIAYQITDRAPGIKVGLAAALWASPSGAALIGEWGVGFTIGRTLTLTSVHVDVISHGTFTPLRMPAGFNAVLPTSIAW